MLLATTALLLQFMAASGIPLPAVALNTDSDVTAVAQAKTEVTHSDGAPEVDAASFENSPEKLLAETHPDLEATYTPGRLTPEPMMPATASVAASFTPALSLRSAAAMEEERRWQQSQKRIWMGLNIAQSGAATFDAWSTRQVISTGAGRELNPMLRPFAGNGSLYAAIEVGPLLLDYVSHRMMMSHHRWARDTWWIPQTVGTVVSLAGGITNVGVLSAR